MPSRSIERIVERRSRSQRMPIALYYKAILNEYTPGPAADLGQDETLHFSSDYPRRLSSRIWLRLCNDPYGDSPESAEARWRAAKLLASQKGLEKARAVLADAEAVISEAFGGPAKGPVGCGATACSARFGVRRTR